MTERSTWSVRGAARAAQRHFTAAQIGFLFAVLFACALIASLAFEPENIATDLPNQIVRGLLLAALLAYAVLYVLMDYRRGFWRAALGASLLMLLALGVWVATPAIVGAAGAEPATDDISPWEVTIGAALIFSPLFYWFSRQALSARWLLSARVEAAGASLVDLMEAADGAFRGQARQGYTARARLWLLGWTLKTVGFLGVAFVVAATLALSFLDQTPFASTARFYIEGAWFVALLALPLSASAVALGRRLSQPDAARLLAADERAPILHLRAFADDPATISAKSAFKRWLYFGFYGRLRLEEAISDELSRLGPYIAVGEPGQSLPSLGASRAYFENHEWREHVQKWISDARLIVMIVGATPSVQWELRQIGAAGKLDRLLLLLPPRPSDDDVKRSQRIHMLRETVADLTWARELEALQAAGALNDAIAVFSDGDGLIAIRSDRPRQTDYEMALRVAIATKFQS